MVAGHAGKYSGWNRFGPVCGCWAGTSEWTDKTCQYLVGKEGQVVHKRIILK